MQSMKRILKSTAWALGALLLGAVSWRMSHQPATQPALTDVALRRRATPAPLRLPTVQSVAPTAIPLAPSVQRTPGQAWAQPRRLPAVDGPHEGQDLSSANDTRPGSRLPMANVGAAPNSALAVACTSIVKTPLSDGPAERLRVAELKE